MGWMGGWDWMDRKDWMFPVFLKQCMQRFSLGMLDAVWGTGSKLVDKIIFIEWQCFVEVCALFRARTATPVAVTPPIKCSLNRRSGARRRGHLFFPPGIPVTCHFGAD
jgi:hypothetical protein